MAKAEAEETDSEKLVKNREGVSLDLSIENLPVRKVTNRKPPDPYIRQHRVKGRTYYTYARGTDKEVYLGSADIILAAVREYRRNNEPDKGVADAYRRANDNLV